MTTTTVYRVENHEGLGPYKSIGLTFHRTWFDDASALDSFSDNIWDDSVENIRPLPEDDGIGKIRPEEVCAFADLSALLSWFPVDVLAVMAKYDMRVKVYEAPEDKVRRGARQVVVLQEVLSAVKEVHCAAIQSLIG